MVRARSCIACGRRTTDGASRCDLHKHGGVRQRPCMVCGRPSASNYCPDHEPEIDEAIRNARNPYRKNYSEWEYRRNRQHRFERARGRCENCGIHLANGEWESDHVIPIRDGGTNAIDNLRILCKPCHRAKTAADRKKPRFE